MQHKHVILILLFVAALVSLESRCFADNNGGSIYSRYGFGDLQFWGTSRAAAMGGTSLAVLSSGDIDLLNPAAWGRINRTRFEIGSTYEGFSTTDGTRSAYLSSLVFNGASFAFPISPASGVVLAGGVTPYSRINYNIRTSGSQAVNSGQYNYDVQYAGNGGISLAQLGLSGTVAGTIGLGVKLNYYFGTLNYTTKEWFPSGNPTDAQVAGEVQRSTGLHGIGTTFGFVFTGLKSLLGLPESHQFNVGGIISTASYLTAREDRYYNFNTTGLVTTDTATVATDGKTRLPLMLGGGVSYLSEKILVTADILYQRWGESGVNTSDFVQLRDSRRIGAGIEFLPKRDPSLPFLQRIAYRLGGFTDATYLEVKGQPINEAGFTGGLGIPIIGDTRLQVGASYSFRGTNDYQLQKDKILRISLTLSGSEQWFVRPPEE